MSLPETPFRAALDLIDAAHTDFVSRFPGDAGRRQPLHVVYGGMHLFSARTPRRLGELARAMLDAQAPGARSLEELFQLTPELAEAVRARVLAKLATEPVEDFRIDAEDGYGHRSDDEEDEHATRAGAEVSTLLEAQGAPPFLGLRIKPLSKELAPRALRTLERFFAALGDRTPAGFIVTLPKVTDARHVSALCDVLDVIEQRSHLRPGTLRVEVMIESGPGLFDREGRCLLPSLVPAARGRLFAAHLGAYDYTASLDIAAPAQRLDHPACDHLRHLMKTSFAGTGVFVADGATTQLPLAPHRGDDLTPAQREENARGIRTAWSAHAANIRRALDQGFFQGWDLHPGQLVPRYVTSFAFFLSHRAAMAKRLSNFVAELGRATAVGEHFDDAATGQGLLNFFLRGWSCGALSDEEVLATGLTLDELKTRDFARILRGRQSRRSV